MIVVADTSPLNYLIQIESDYLLSQLYQRILVPGAVIEELAHPDAPTKVQAWLSRLPEWVEVCQTAFLPDADVALLDRGEREAIQLAVERNAELLLIDERKGREVARRRGFATTGTLGVLLDAGFHGLVNPELAYRRLVAETTFRTSASLEAHFMSQISRV